MAKSLDGNVVTANPLWINPEYQSPLAEALRINITINDVLEAQKRLARFAPLLQKLFPELVASDGIVESPLLELPHEVVDEAAAGFGKFWVKSDHQLAVAGSIKARGGFHEVLEFAEKVALQNDLIQFDDSYGTLDSSAARECFSRYEVAVGSTGNLGLSIGIMSTALGFKSTVHMSSEAKEWKKRTLRSHGVKVLEYSGDYGLAVASGRQIAQNNPRCHFVDDEHSVSLFCGYAVAAFRLRDQFLALNIAVDAEHPLFVYIPCGVGGAPGGVCFGLKSVFGAAVHCFFVEPADSACFLVQMQNLDSPGISIYKVGQCNKTIADGLAVPTASELVYPLMRDRLSGIVIASEERIYSDLWRLKSLAGLKVEPSGAAAVSGPRALFGTHKGQRYLREHGVSELMHQASHILWATGGILMPSEEFESLLKDGEVADRKLRKEARSSDGACT